MRHLTRAVVFCFARFCSVLLRRGSNRTQSYTGTPGAGRVPSCCDRGSAAQRRARSPWASSRSVRHLVDDRAARPRRPRAPGPGAPHARRRGAARVSRATRTPSGPGGSRRRGQASARRAAVATLAPGQSALPGLLVDRVLRRPRASSSEGRRLTDHHELASRSWSWSRTSDAPRTSSSIGVGGSLRTPDAVVRRPVRRPHRPRRTSPTASSFSVKGSRRDGALTDADPLEAEVKRAMIAARRAGLPAHRRLEARGARAERRSAGRRPGGRLRLRGADPTRSTALRAAGAASGIALERGRANERRRVRSSSCATPRSPTAPCARCATRNIALRPGEVRGLVGENGAGKSTIVQLLGGVSAATPARCSSTASRVDFHSPPTRATPGIAVIYQEPTLFPDLSRRGERDHGPPAASARSAGSIAARCTGRSRACSTASASGSTPERRCAASRSPTSRSSRSPRR